MSAPYLNIEKLKKLVSSGDSRITTSSKKILAAIKPSIRIKTEQLQGEYVLGGSRMGGLPDLPLDTHWPTLENKYPMIFLGQINLKDLSSFSCASILPKDGILSFFVVDPHDEKFEKFVLLKPGVFESKNITKVLFIAGKDLVRKNAPAGVSVLKSCVLTFGEEETFPQFESAAYEAIGVGQGIFTELVSDAVEEEQTLHRILGYPDQIQGDVAASVQQCFEKNWENPDWESLAEQGKELILLFQMDSDDNLDVMWGDGGMLYFYIKPEDLANTDFSNVWCEEQCY